MISSSESSYFPIWGVFVGVFLFGLTVTFLIRDLYWSPLSVFPGPKLWALSRIPLQISILKGRNHQDILRLHEKYGPVIRISPNELAFNTAQGIRDIYGSRPGGDFTKDPSHYLPPPNNTHNVVSAIENSAHARQRRLLAPAFTERALKDQECLIQGYVDTMICKIRSQIDQDPLQCVDILSWLNYTTFDITGDLMFGESFDCLKDNRLHPWISLLFNSIKSLAIVGVTTQFPILHTLLQALIPASVKRQGEDHFNLAARKVDRRLEASSSRPDFVSAISKHGVSEAKGQLFDAEHILSRAEIHSNAFILIIAGSETAATCLAGCIYYLCKNPQALTLLVKEIRSAFNSDIEMTFRANSELKYLSAVIEEALRHYPPLVTNLCRIVPKGGAHIDGHFVPGGTVVSMHHYASYHSTSNFASPNEFIPERWLDADARFANDNRAVLQPFSYGPRGCLGKSLAYAEMKLILCKLFWHFDVSLSSQCDDWHDQDVFFFWDKPPLMVSLRDRFAEDLSFE